MKPWSTIWLCRLTDRGNTPASPGPLTDASAFKIDCATPEGATEPVFTATGALDDNGPLEGAPLPVGQGRSAWIGHRRFRGRKGLLFLLVDTRFVTRGSTVARGTFEIVDGTEAYAGLQGYGAYRATVDEKGQLAETFLGRLKDTP